MQGSCSPVSQPNRPACQALRIFLAIPSSGNCTTAGGSWTTSGVCNDTLPSHQSAGMCTGPDRLWNSATSTCAVVLLNDDRNDVSCMQHNGRWVTTGTCIGNWVMPMGNLYTPNVLTWNGSSAPGPGDQCLRCHNSRTQYNSARVRDTEDTMFMGHKNMSRKVTVGKPWGGPPFHCVSASGSTEEECYDNGGNWVPVAPYPSTDTGDTFNWTNGTVNNGGLDKTLYWIYGDWLSALPRAIYADTANTGTVPFSPNVSYSCARCHTTGWKSDSGINYGMGIDAASSTREPEKSFHGITWDGVTDAVSGQVNLKGSVSGDSNLSSSWDGFGIVCSRCHSSAIYRDSTNPYNFSSPESMSSHHSNLTAADFPASCTVSGKRDQTSCEAAAGVWYYGYCTDSRFLAGGVPAATARTNCETAGGSNIPPAPGVPLGTWVTPCTINLFATQSDCTGGGGAWNLPASTCSVAGLCNDPAMTSAGTCVGTVSGGPLDGLVRQWKDATDIIRCDDAGGRWTGSYTQRGQVITALCMNCHRQETSGLPYDSTNPSTVLKVGPAHGTINFVSHPHGNQFLNSPHGKFTGTFAQISTGKFKYDMTGEYKSFFLADGEAANTGNGCTGCHDVHTSTVTGEHPFREECTDCHAKNLSSMIHPRGTGTPLGDLSDPFEACVSCHMPEGKHLFRIKADASYSTFPASALTSTVNANTSPDGTFTSAVWVDVDAACGQCHGGGLGQAITTGSTTAGSPALTVTSSASFTVGQKIEVPGAGSLYYDDMGQGYNADFETFIKAIPDATTITLLGNASATVNGVQVTQNATKNGAGYKTKTTLATQAKGIHNDKPYVTFSYTTSGLTVNVNAAGSTCSGSASNCDAYNWDFGDGGTGSGIATSHLYASAGTKSITLTVHQYGVSEGSTTKNVNVYAAADAPPVVSSTFNCDANNWMATLTDTSTDDHLISKYTVYWGDGTPWVTQYPPSATFTKTFTTTGTRTVQHKVYDSLNQVSAESMPPCTIAYFQISGTVKNLAGTVNLASAKVQIKLNGVLVKTVYTNSSGVYTAGSLKPGTYKLYVTKTGYTFASPAATATVGPNKVRNINAQ